MTVYTYTLNPTGMTADENIRAGFRTPRSILLPPYLSHNDYYVALMDAVDAVFETNVDIPTETLGNLRNMWVTNPTLENNQIENSEMIPFEAWSQPERAILVQQVNMLGMKLQAAGVLSNDNYQSIARWVGLYWFGKGTINFINFINYCLSSSLAIVQLWTQDFITFLPTGDPGIGVLLWEGGTWYPTPLVSITAAGGLQSIDVQTLTTFFYDIANYNLVLQNIAQVFDLPVVADEGDAATEIVAIGLHTIEVIPISNLYSFDADGPPLLDDQDVPTTALTNNPTNPDLTGTFMLAAPNSWLQDTQGRIFPMYDKAQQQPFQTVDIPANLCGATEGAPSSVIYGPVQWQAVPTGQFSSARVPSFSTTPVAKTAQLSELTTFLVGIPTCLLVNPVGFAEFVPGSGLVVPFWMAAS